MAEDDKRFAEEKEREEREGFLVSNRLSELYEDPIKGNFDAEHLKAVHAYIFQDLPEHYPGQVRHDTHDRWTKNRVLEGASGGYEVHYAHENIEPRIAETLTAFGGADGIKGLPVGDAADRLASLYGDLDHAHGFYEGNSRTLREFTRELANEAGYELDWAATGAGAKERNQLYIARDVDVLQRAFPGLTPERGMETNDRAEYEASLALDGLTRRMGEDSLAAIIRGGLTPQLASEQADGAAAGVEVGQDSESNADLSSGVNRAAGSVMSAAADILDGVADKVGDAIDAVADSLAGLFGGGSSAPKQEHTAPAQHPVEIDSSRFSPEEMDQRRAALLSRYNRDVNVEQEQTLDHEERLKRDDGQSYR